MSSETGTEWRQYSSLGPGTRGRTPGCYEVVNRCGRSMIFQMSDNLMNKMFGIIRCYLSTICSLNLPNS